MVDSSGLKLSGPGEWLVEKHGTSKRRSWRKFHIGFDAVSGRIVASILTDRDVDDASQVEPLLDQIADPVELFLGDGGYDRTGVYTTLDERHPAATVVIPPRADAVLSATAEAEPTQRDGHIQAIAGKGRMAWQRDSGYNERARVEGQIARWKQVIGEGLACVFRRSPDHRGRHRRPGPQPNARPWTSELRPRRLINRGGWGLLCLFFLRATLQHKTWMNLIRCHLAKFTHDPPPTALSHADSSNTTAIRISGTKL